MNTLIIYSAQYLFIIIVIISIVYWLTLSKQKKISMAIFGVVTAMIAYALSRIASLLYYNPRPFVVHHTMPLIKHAADNGFPSDHTLLSAVIAFVVFRYSKKLGAVLLILTLLVGLSRIAAGVHSPLDIIGAIVLAYIASLVSVPIEKLIRKRFSKA